MKFKTSMLSKLIVAIALSVGVVGCGADVGPQNAPSTVDSAKNSAALSTLQSNPTIQREVKANGFAKFSVDDGTDGAEGSDGAQQAVGDGAFTDLTSRCVCCKMWGDRVVCTYISCTSECTY
jgi:hypothetical protein